VLHARLLQGLGQGAQVVGLVPLGELGQELEPLATDDALGPAVLRGPQGGKQGDVVGVQEPFRLGRNLELPLPPAYASSIQSKLAAVWWR
jgi:hypothetical protein